MYVILAEQLYACVQSKYSDYKINLDNVHLNHQLLMNKVKQLSSYGCELRLNNETFWPASSSFSVT